MPHTFSNLIVAPIIGWLTLMALVVVGYLLSLEIAERRRNRRLDAKRAELGLLERDRIVFIYRTHRLSSRLNHGQISRIPTGSSSDLRLKSRKHRAQSPQSRNRRSGCLRPTQWFEKQTFKFQRPPPFEID